MLISDNQDLSTLQMWIISASQQSYERGTIIENVKEKKSKDKEIQGQWWDLNPDFVATESMLLTTCCDIFWNGKRHNKIISKMGKTGDKMNI